MPTSVRGNSDRSASSASSAGFTLIEMLVVVAIVAIGAGLVALAIRDPAQSRLELDATRLTVLLENARIESRATGVAAIWVPNSGTERDAEPFRFLGLPGTREQPTRWLDPGVSAQVVGAPGIVLGPDAILPPQRVVLRLDNRQVEVGSDGLAPFALLPPSAPVR